MPEISIIICSRNNSITEEFRKNIDETIGCDYQLVIVDNSQNNYSIFEAYNIGIDQSTADILCFVHDDILFHSENWGKKLKELFKNHPEFGLIGIAGSKIKTKTTSGWWDCQGDNMLVQIIQRFPNGVKEHQHYGFEGSTFEEAVVVDGVFMALKKEIDYYFPTYITGFHGYDLILSFDVIINGYKIGVTDEILLEHFSIGNPNYGWLINVDKIHTLYKKILPLKTSTGNMAGEELENCERILNLSYQLKKWKLFSKYWCRLLLLKPEIKLHYRIFNKLRYGTK
ncbi:glycosyltransferase [Christiangramia salexigens]|uniref:Streptomycin biosynthesis protein StrF domain-containing protein n=1 Tax=Christiangramia salexigens TaxID=1913577 RepID=A0A1L3J4T4_9FLAO|nr:glycosyltransferase [Christiangramia salexigens]APG60114.1 hypothetical protein LPB144_06650 [Christiangramia salexigens]